MLYYSGLVLGVSVLTGIVLLALYQWGKPSGRVWLPGAAHGLIGLAGAALLLVGLRAPARGASSGAGSFGTIAAVMVAGALALGLYVAVSRLRGRQSSALVLGVHATLAVAGLTLLAAYVSAPP